MGFNPMQPGKTKPGDVALFLFGLAMIVGLVVWAIHG
jgi:hypothetical protein